MSRSWPKGFSMITRRQRPLASSSQAGQRPALDYGREEARRGGEVIEVIAVGAVIFVDLAPATPSVAELGSGVLGQSPGK